ncbi:MAG: antibiotic biosynthesis monooxygenase [Nitrospirota bacterium]|nr:antibiotic biosynthesis monooxygenase [Nitrospirota bacterium]
MFVAMNRFTVTAGREAEFETAWRERDSRLAEVPGFRDFLLLKGDGEYISHSTWDSAEAFAAWTESEAFAMAHRQRLPEGVLAGPPRFSGYDVVLRQEAPRADRAAVQAQVLR